MRNVHINAGNGGSGYDVVIGSGLLSEAGKRIREVLKAERVALFTDSSVNSLYGDTVEKQLADAGFKTFRYVFPAGEESKNLGTVASFIDFMAEQHLSRKDAVIVLGGGVAGDMGGFAASIYLRGIKFVQIPTSLLAAVDSSVGGKTGVDIDAGKNLVGAFGQRAKAVHLRKAAAPKRGCLLLRIIRRCRKSRGCLHARCPRRWQSRYPRR